MTCSKCGSKIEDDSTFCPFCGNKIKNEKLENNFDSNVSTDNVSNSNELVTNNVTLMSSVPTNNYEDLNTKSLIFGILGFFIFPCAIIAICMGASYKKKTNKTSAGLVLGIISCILGLVIIFILSLFFVFSLKYASEIKRHDSNDNYLKDYYENGSNINYQTIGNDEFGYLTVSKDWHVYTSANNNSTLQYSYGSTSDILTLYAIKDTGYTLEQYAQSIKSKIQSYGADNVSYEIVNVGQYKAIKQQAYLTTLSSYMTTWCFKDENDVLHYISVNSDNSNNYQDMVTTFRLKK